MSNRLREIRTSRDLTLQQLADLVGTSNQQISALERGKIRLTYDWMRRIADALDGVEPEDLIAEGPLDLGRIGLGEAELVPWTPPPCLAGTAENDAPAIVALLAPGRTNASAFELRSRALDLAGYLQGDTLIVDLNALAPEPGAVVCAQIYDWQAMKAVTVLRIFEPPYLVASSTEPRFRKPELIDNDRVTLKGTVVASFRVEPRGE